MFGHDRRTLALSQSQGLYVNTQLQPLCEPLHRTSKGLEFRLHVLGVGLRRKIPRPSESRAKFYEYATLFEAHSPAF